MTILFTAGREIEYTRNEVMLSALDDHADVIMAVGKSKNYILRLFTVLMKIIWTTQRYHDVVFIGFYGQILVPWVRLFTRKPIVFDAFISTYQTLCFDRKKYKPKSMIGRFAYYTDKIACSIADTVILDTDAHCDYFAATFNLPRSKFKTLFVSANEKMFVPAPANTVQDVLRVFTYTAYQPLHGVETILEAAAIVGNKAKFILAGDGKGRQKIIESAKGSLDNVEFLKWVPYAKLPELIAKADLCLGGHFGNTAKADLVIAGKTFQFTAMSKPTIITNSPSNTELFPHDSQYMIKKGSAKELAAIIIMLSENPSLLPEIAKKQYDAYVTKASNKVISLSLRDILEKYNYAPI